MKTTIIDKTYTNYLSLLKKLVSMNTVYSNEEGIHKALQFCKKHFEKNLKNFEIYFDGQSNLICISRAIDPKRDILYLSAHIDTVPANKKEWDLRYNPFVPFEDATSIVGRGVSDDKAGVAYQLYLAKLFSEHDLSGNNIVFTISSREEQGGTSAKEIGNQLGKKLPVGPQTYLITLENSVHVTDPPILCINYGERGAIGIEVTDILRNIKMFLEKDKNLWNPTVIMPTKDVKNIRWETLEQTGGHAATFPEKKI